MGWWSAEAAGGRGGRGIGKVELGEGRRRVKGNTLGEALMGKVGCDCNGREEKGREIEWG